MYTVYFVKKMCQIDRKHEASYKVQLCTRSRTHFEVDHGLFPSSIQSWHRNTTEFVLNRIKSCTKPNLISTGSVLLHDKKISEQLSWANTPENRDFPRTGNPRKEDRLAGLRDGVGISKRSRKRTSFIPLQQRTLDRKYVQRIDSRAIKDRCPIRWDRSPSGSIRLV